MREIRAKLFPLLLRRGNPVVQLSLQSQLVWVALEHAIEDAGVVGFPLALVVVNEVSEACVAQRLEVRRARALDGSARGLVQAGQEGDLPRHAAGIPRLSLLASSQSRTRGGNVARMFPVRVSASAVQSTSRSWNTMLPS